MRRTTRVREPGPCVAWTGRLPRRPFSDDRRLLMQPPAPDVRRGQNAPPNGSCYIRRRMAQQYIFTMQNLRKVVPPQREILRGIYLSFFPGAKIGILGLNGSGKSTVLRIMAGVEKEFTG